MYYQRLPSEDMNIVHGSINSTSGEFCCHYSCHWEL